MDTPRLSAIILTYRRAGYLRECLASLAAADRRPLAELLVVVNGDDPESESILASWAARLPELRVLSLERRSRGAARNEAALRASGEILYFLDDDLVVAPDIFARAAAFYAGNAQVWALGGPNLTPDSDSAFQKAVGAALSSRFGAWTMSRRYRAGGAAGPVDDKSLMLCNLSARREVFGELGLRFAESLASAEENLLLSELAFRGRGLFYDPALVVYHHRRPGLAGFAAQTFKCGAGRWQATRLSPASFSPLFALPSALLLFIAAAPFLPKALSAAVFALYAALAAAQAAAYGLSGGGLSGACLVAGLIPAGHLSYGAGFLLGELSWAARASSRRTSSLPGWSAAAAESCASASPPRLASIKNRA